MKTSVDSNGSTRSKISEIIGSIDTYNLISLLPLRPYHAVADVACGSGRFAVALGKVLWQGKLYAMDCNEDLVKLCHQQIERARLSNVEVFKRSERDFRLGKQSMDGVFLAFGLHEAEDPNVLLSHIADLLKPGGWCVVLEWFKHKTKGGPPVKSLIAPAKATACASRAGLVVDKCRDLNGCHYLLMLHKSASSRT